MIILSPSTLQVPRLMNLVSIDSSLEGINYGESKQLISREIPEGQSKGTEVSVIFLLENAEGDESFHIEKIVIPCNRLLEI